MTDYTTDSTWVLIVFALLCAAPVIAAWIALAVIRLSGGKVETT